MILVLKVVERVLRGLEGEFNEGEPILCTVRLSGILEKDKRDGFRSIARQLCEFLNVRFLQQLSAEQNIKFLNAALRKLHE